MDGSPGSSRSPRARLSQVQLTRHRFLGAVGGVAGLVAAGQLAGRIVSGEEEDQVGVPAFPVFPRRPFTLGVASGDPLPDSVVLWTRLAPDPLNGGGVGRAAVPVGWQIASDERMRRVVRRGTVLARPELGHSLHVDVKGLEPGRWYWYQFRAGPEVSPVGRTRTAPATGAPLERLRFAFASCQNYEQGYYTAYRHMVREELELVVHLGDYIYEGRPQPTAPTRPRQHNGQREPLTLSDYRNRYALYKSDPELQGAHAAFPWIVTWDDHEVDNNYAGEIDQDDSAPDAFLARRANAYQAYYEHMPLRVSSLPDAERLNMQLYRRFTYGNLAEFSVLDTRQYRTDQPCGDGTKPRCPEAFSETATMTGAEQERWLLDGLGASRSRWNVIAQQVMLAQLDLKVGAEQEFPMDHWSGYVAARNRLLAFLAQRRPSNPVVLTGDIHSNWVADVKANFDDPRSATVGTEFVGTSISSGGDGTDSSPLLTALQPENPHIKFFNNQRGYVRCTLTRERWQTDFRVVPVVSTPGADIVTRASFVVEDGRPGAEPL